MSTARFFNFKMNGSARRRPPQRGRWIEYAAMGLFGLSCLHLLWVIVLPLPGADGGPAREPSVPGVEERLRLFQSYDPFYPSAMGQDGSQTVTSLPIKLFGTRLNEGSGLGSAIIATPDGVQSSFAVGDEIMPGVRLKAVAFDHVVISQGGVEESIFLDQSAGSDTPVVNDVNPEEAVEGNERKLSGGRNQKSVSDAGS